MSDVKSAAIGEAALPYGGFIPINVNFAEFCVDVSCALKAIFTRRYVPSHQPCVRVVSLSHQQRLIMLFLHFERLEMPLS